MRNFRAGLTLVLNDQLSTPLARTAGNFNTFAARATAAGARLQSIGRTSQDVGRSLMSGVTAPLVGFATGSVLAAGRLDRLRSGLTAVTGSAAEAGRQMERLRVIARAPGLGYAEAVGASVSLQAVGMDAATAERSIRLVGNALATTGGTKDDFAEVVRQFTQIQSLGKVTAENLNVIRERAPAISGALQRAFAGRELSTVPVREFTTTLLGELSRLPTAAPSLLEPFVNAVDDAQMALVPFGQAFARNVTPFLATATGALAHASTAFAGLSPPVQNVAVGIAAVAAAAGPALIGFGWLAEGMGKGIEQAGKLAEGFGRLVARSRAYNSANGLMTAGNAASAGSFRTLATAAQGRVVAGLRGATTAMWSFTTAALANPLTWIAVGIGAAAFTIWKYWAPLKAWFGSLWAGIKAGAAPLLPVFERIGAAVAPIGAALGRVWDTAKSFFRGLTTQSEPSIGQIARLTASGAAFGQRLGQALVWVADRFRAVRDRAQSLWDKIQAGWAATAPLRAWTGATLSKAWDDARAAVESVTTRLRAAWAASEPFRTWAVDKLAEGWAKVQTGIEWVRNTVSDLWAKTAPLRAGFSAMFEKLSPHLATVGGWLTKIAGYVALAFVAAPVVFLVGAVVTFVAALATAAAVFSFVWDTGVRTWEALKSGATATGERIEAMWNRVKSFFTGFSLADSGRRLIDTFIEGIKGAASSLYSTVSGVMGTVREFFPFSPARRGPLSDLDRTGGALVRTAAAGITSGPFVSALTSAMGDARGTLGNGFSMSMGAAALAPSMLAASGPDRGGQSGAAAPAVVLHFAPVVNIGAGAGPEVRAAVEQALASQRVDFERQLVEVMRLRERRTL
ncbi:MAG TPA: tape measure protein [Rubricoccaceae bacterium]